MQSRSISKFILGATAILLASMPLAQAATFPVVRADVDDVTVEGTLRWALGQIGSHEEPNLIATLSQPDNLATPTAYRTSPFSAPFRIDEILDDTPPLPEFDCEDASVFSQAVNRSGTATA
ncbi:MAG: hypothetical protein HYV27_20095 [Candidatus Hydrogenedentes bacterium]|nr:hypothetical protein [Candidatus Hydrogenedentota bacterium]